MCVSFSVCCFYSRFSSPVYGLKYSMCHQKLHLNRVQCSHLYTCAKHVVCVNMNKYVRFPHSTHCHLTLAVNMMPPAHPIESLHYFATSSGLSLSPSPSFSLYLKVGPCGKSLPGSQTFALSVQLSATFAPGWLSKTRIGSKPRNRKKKEANFQLPALL